MLPPLPSVIPQRAWARLGTSTRSFQRARPIHVIAPLPPVSRCDAHTKVVQGLKALEGEGFPNGAVVEVRDADYNLLSFEEQIQHDLETDIMVSWYGWVSFFACSLVVEDSCTVGFLVLLFACGRTTFYVFSRYYSKRNVLSFQFILKVELTPFRYIWTSSLASSAGSQVVQPRFTGGED